MGKQEVKTADGVIRGAYSYVDSDGIVQTVNYIADGLGFRVGATNLPVHEVDAPAAAPMLPQLSRLLPQLLKLLPQLRQLPLLLCLWWLLQWMLPTTNSMPRMTMASSTMDTAMVIPPSRS